MDQLISILRNHAQEMTPVGTETTPKISKLPGIRAVVFDVYGTLLISASGDVGTVAAAPAEAFEQACAAVGLTILGEAGKGPSALVAAIEASHARSREQGIDYPEVDIVDVWHQTIESLIESATITNPQQEVDYSALAVEYEVRVNPVWPMPGLERCLATIKSAELTMGIVSNAQFFTPLLFPACLGETLSQLGFSDELNVWSFQHGRAKPGLYLYQRSRELLASHGVEPGEVLYVGNDLLNDVMPAQKVGFRTALFAGDRRSLRWRDGDPRVAGVAPDLTITHLEQISEVLGLSTSSGNRDG